MGRPLNKKYFGNRNIGSTSTTADNGIGGEGVASITTATAGSININDTYKTFPALNVAAPELPGGVTATTAVTWEIESITIGGTNTGYTINQTGAAAILTGLESQASVDPVITINTNGSGNVSAISFAGGRGEWTSIDGTGITTWAINGAGGSNAQATVKFRVKSIAIVERGSGYIAVPSLAWGTLGGTTPSGQTPSLTTDSGAPRSSTNQENAIICYAYIPTANGGSSRVIGDIVKQVSTNRYKVKTAQGTGICKLVTDGSSGAGKMDITAYDTAENPGVAGEYWVTKLCNRDVTLVSKGGGIGGTDFTNGKKVKWSFTTTTAPSGTDYGTAKIQNA